MLKGDKTGWKGAHIAGWSRSSAAGLQPGAYGHGEHGSPRPVPLHVDCHLAAADLAKAIDGANRQVLSTQLQLLSV